MSKLINPDAMSKFDRQYLTDRGIDPDEYSAKFELVDGELVGRDDYEEETDAERNQVDSDDPRLSDGGDPEKDDPDTDADDYSTWDVKALQAEIATRNEGRDEDNQVVPEGTGKEGRLRKSDLVSALNADDANGDDEDDS